MKSKKIAFCLALLVFLFFCDSMARADEISLLKEEIRKQQELLAEQQRAMNQLMLRLKELEQRQVSYENTQKTLTEKTENMEKTQASDRDLGAQAKQDARSRFGGNLRAFGDVSYSSHSREKAANSFSVAEMSLYSTASYGDHLSFLSEIEIEMEEAETSIELERMWVGYTFNDLLTVRAGKQNTALGYWNKTYHRGKQLFTTMDRPFFLVSEHEGSIMPLHIVGVELEGSTKYGDSRLKYELQVGNGPAIDSVRKLHPNNAADDNNSKMVAMRLSARPGSIQGLNLGIFGSGYRLDTSTKNNLLQTVAGVDISFTRANTELILEYFRLRNSRESANAFYAQLGYTFRNVWTPYVRYEYLNYDRNDPYFADLLTGGRKRWQAIAGLKYDLDVLRSSIKVQYRHDEQEGDRTYNVVETQWSFSF